MIDNPPPPGRLMTTQPPAPSTTGAPEDIIHVELVVDGQWVIGDMRTAEAREIYRYLQYHCVVNKSYKVIQPFDHNREIVFRTDKISSMWGVEYLFD